MMPLLEADPKKVREVVLAAVEELNRELPEAQRLDATPDAVLFGRDGRLDSLGLVRLVVAVEQGLAETFGVTVALADERAMSQRHSPFRTVATLAEYAAGLVAEQRRA